MTTILYTLLEVGIYCIAIPFFAILLWRKHLNRCDNHLTDADIERIINKMKQ